MVNEAPRLVTLTDDVPCSGDRDRDLKSKEEGVDQRSRKKKGIDEKEGVDIQH